MPTSLPKRGAAVSVAALLLASLLAIGCEKKPNGPVGGPPPPPTVLVAEVTQRDVPLYVESVASVDGYVNAEIRARVRGFLASQRYKDGAEVKENELLFTIDPSEFGAAVSAAKGAVEQAQASKQRAELDRDRNVALVDRGVVSKQVADNAVATSAEAGGQLQQARAQLVQSQLNLGYTQIRSPVNGIAGLALVRVGNLVGVDGPTLLTTVSQIDPMRVNFPISELDFLAFGDRFKNLDKRDLAWAKRQFATLASGGEPEENSAVELVLANGKPFPERGVIVATNRQIDPSSGTITVQALFPNPEKALRPGQFGRVRIRRDDAGKRAILVPARALLQVQGTYSLAVVGDGNKVQVRKVEIGPTVGALQIIERGVNPGEKVIVEGLQKAPDGTVVVPRPAPVDSAGAASAAPSASAPRLTRGGARRPFPTGRAGSGPSPAGASRVCSAANRSSEDQPTCRLFSSGARSSRWSSPSPPCSSASSRCWGSRSRNSRRFSRRRST